MALREYVMHEHTNGRRVLGVVADTELIVEHVLQLVGERGAFANLALGYVDLRLAGGGGAIFAAGGSRHALWALDAGLHIYG